MYIDSICLQYYVPKNKAMRKRVLYFFLPLPSPRGWGCLTLFHVWESQASHATWMLPCFSFAAQLTLTHDFSRGSSHASVWTRIDVSDWIEGFVLDSNEINFLLVHWIRTVCGDWHSDNNFGPSIIYIIYVNQSCNSFKFVVKPELAAADINDQLYDINDIYMYVPQHP